MLRPSIFSSNKPMFFDHAFDRFFDHAFSDFWGNEISPQSSFKTDVLDEGEHYLLQAELPGFAKEDIHIDLSNDMLTISAAHEDNTEENDKQQNYLRKERRYSSYQRSFYVEGVTPSDIDAEYKNGILEVRFPKKEIASKEEPLRIEVK